MAMEISNAYNNYAGNYTNTMDNRKRTTESSTTKTTGNSTAKEEYLRELNKKYSTLNLMAGGVNTNYRSGNYPNKVDVMIAPSILEKMASDPNEAKKYEKMLADIPQCEKWANASIKAMTGNEVKYRQVWIDENGNMGSFSISGPSEKQKKIDEERKKNEQEQFEERLEKTREKRIQFEEWLYGDKDQLPDIKVVSQNTVKAVSGSLLDLQI